MTPKKLKAECLEGDPQNTMLATCSVIDHENPSGKHVGHAFATVWQYESQSEGRPLKVGWITQLVVHKEYRNRRIATMLTRTLNMSKVFDSVDALGVASSNAFTCRVVGKFACKALSFSS